MAPRATSRRAAVSRSWAPRSSTPAHAWTIHPDRKLAERRTYPAIDLNRSSTRREELLLDAATVSRIWVLRKVLSPLTPVDSMEFLLEKLKRTDSNEQFLNSMNQ